MPHPLAHAMSLHRAGDHRAAESAYRALLAKAPANADLLQLLGVLRLQQGAVEEGLGLLARALRENPSHAAARLNHGHGLRLRGRFAEALAEYAAVPEGAPEKAAAHLAAAQLHVAGQAPAAAERELVALLRHDPGHFEGRQQLAILLAGQHRFAEARALFSRLLREAPDHAPILGNLARVERRLGNGTRAKELARILIARDAASLEGHLILGLTEMDAGKGPQAALAFENALAKDPFNPEALDGLAQVSHVGRGDPLLARLEAALARDKLTPADRAMLHYAQARLQDQAGDPSAAIGAALLAKAADRQTFDMAHHRARLAAMITHFDAAFFAARADYGSASTLPVFVLGMPRSGTTLAEQVIASHPMGAGAGELGFFQGLARKLGFAGPPEEFIARAKNFSAGEAQFLAAAYVADLARRHPGAERVVDKMPHNFEQAWLIRLLFPKAAIIHCTRAAADNCLSIFLHHFSSAHGYAADMESLGRYWLGYQRLMEHWQAVLPGPAMHRHDYRHMVENPQAATRTLLAAVGLPFDDACLAPEENARPILTFSRLAVREKVHARSLDKWRDYAPYITPLLAALAGA